MLAPSKMPKLRPSSETRPSSSFYALDAASASTSVARKPRGLRNAGKLQKLMDMPVDIFLEITAHLVPLDVLHLSRASRRLRDILMTKNSKPMWRAARKQIPGLPDCPVDLSEAQYAALLFEHECMVCGVSRAQKLDYRLRVRCCAKCYKENVFSSKDLATRFPSVKPLILVLLPHITTSPAKNSKKRGTPVPGEGEWYFAPHVAAMSRRYDRCQAESALKLKNFITERRNAVRMIEPSVQQLRSWESTRRHDQAVDDREQMELRQRAIEERLLELGWDERDLPRTNPARQDYAKLVNQPRELSEKIWKAILPKLEAVRQEIWDERNRSIGPAIAEDKEIEVFGDGLADEAAIEAEHQAGRLGSHSTEESS